MRKRMVDSVDKKRKKTNTCDQVSHEGSNENQQSKKRRKSHPLAWQARYEDLVEFRNEFDHTNVPQNYAKNMKLALWVKVQRSQYKTGILIQERINQLNELSFVWDSSVSERWQTRYDQLVEFRNEFGHTNVRINYAKNMQLAAWVKFQRYQYKNNTLIQERIDKLDALSFVWDCKNKKKATDGERAEKKKATDLKRAEKKKATDLKRAEKKKATDLKRAERKRKAESTKKERPEEIAAQKESLNKESQRSAKRQKLDYFQDHPCVKGIVKENQQGKTLYTEKEIMKQMEDTLSTMNLTDVNRVIVYAYVCGILGHSSSQTVRNSGPRCFRFDGIQTISEHQTYRIDRIQSGADCDPNLCCMFHSPFIHPECKIELIGQSLMNNFIIDEFFSKENGFATTIGTESSSSNGTPFGPGISDRNADRQKATMRESQLATLQDLELSTSDGIQETKVALYNNFLQVKSDAIIANQNTDEMQADNTVIEACSRSDNRKIGSVYDNNERLIKLNPNSDIESQLHHVNSNHLRLKGSLPRNQWSNSRNNTNIFQKKRSIRFSIGLRDTGKWLLHVLGSMRKSTQKKLLQDPFIYKSATCRLQAYMKIDPNDPTKNSLTLLLVCDYLQGQEPTKKDIDDSRTLFAYDAFDIEQLFKANNGTFTTKLLAEDSSSVQVPITLHRDSALLESHARFVMHKQLIDFVAAV